MEFSFQCWQRSKRASKKKKKKKSTMAYLSIHCVQASEDNSLSAVFRVTVSLQEVKANGKKNIEEITEIDT